jgi:hypothetical protein
MDLNDLAKIFTAGDYKVSIVLAVILLTSIVRTQGVKLWARLGTGWAAWCVAILFGVASSVAPHLLPGAEAIGGAGALAGLILEGAQNGLIAAGQKATSKTPSV